MYDGKKNIFDEANDKREQVTDKENEAKSVFASFRDFIANYYKEIISIILIVGACIICYKVYTSLTEEIQELKQAKEPVIMTPTQATDTNFLRNTTGMRKSDAESTVRYIEKAQTGQVSPVGSITITTTSPEKASEKVVEMIKDKDPSLPPEALKKSDKTIVAPQPENKDYQVGVYKINNYKNWSMGTGVGVLGSKAYVPLVLERQFNNTHSVELQANVTTDGTGPKIDGGQIVYKIHF